MEGINGVDGLVSGLPTSDLIDASIEAARGATRLVEANRTIQEFRLEAVRTLNLRALSAQLDVSDLRREATFDGLTGSVSNEQAAAISVNNSAQPGTYSFHIDALATAQQLSTAGQASATSSNGTGTLQIQVGQGSVETIDFSSGASSLQQIAEQIGAAELGVLAFVVDDGTANGQRLMLQSEATGLSQTIQATGTGALATLFGTNSSALTEVQAASDAQIRFGEGANAVTISRSSNTIDDVIQGVDITLIAEASDVSVTVAQDPSGARSAIESFVESFNSTLQYFKDNSSYDTVNNEAGALFSESDLRTAFNSMRNSMLNEVLGPNGDSRTLAGIGISFDAESGLLETDDAQLSDVLANDFEAVRNLFVNSGTSTDSGVDFLFMTSATDVSNPFTVDITTAATQALMTGSSAVADGVTITAGSNDVLDVNVNGTDYSITLAAATYATKEDLVEHVAEALQGAVGDRIEVGLNGSDQLAFNSVAYGSTQSITIEASSTALGALGLSAGSHTGVDVAGTINGEQASGGGQVLRGVEGTASEGLSLLATASAPVSAVTVTVSEGLGQRLHESLTNLTESSTGVLSRKESFFESTIEEMTERISRSDELLAAMRERLEAEFLAMEVLLGQYQTQQDFLAGQIAGFENLALGRVGGGQ